VVRERAQQTYDIDIANIAENVRKVLDGHSSYSRTSKRVGAGGNTIIFYANVRVNIPLTLGTDMYISLSPVGAQTDVVVTVESQPRLYSDAFGFYDPFIRTFFDRLSASFQNQYTGLNMAIKTGSLVFVRERNLTSVIFMGVLLLIFAA
jgi:hypothetical protein